ncbi:saccharopine dehydrogenase C-terminal domain-containing protein [Sedimentimonas flavescens]|uniref:saccharopine dehydrogenase C-terminal domain-containing protein n=1 Tax=Sedimentimonas flavescens TaxID=2851012 RepID=UPI0021A3A740|nr:saccharopine dehydrogenase C-terminal domain-containing protein [Sedimentimonas flavescens]MCT2540914.1 saccharopine dehydrogenase NADP-binding domain-containing protein [Sedimentimonas flavescens]
MGRIHWCGTGLSSGPGLRRLIDAGHAVTVWTIDEPAAYALLAGREAEISGFSQQALEATVQPGEVIVSMLPPDLHGDLAQIAVRRGAHFACSSYLSKQLRDLDGPAREAGVTILAEVGLDPGIDHLMAHDLVAGYRASGKVAAGNTLSFHSYCGGIPAHPNAFRYKFSWSPLGVLRALRTPARSIRHFTELKVRHPWEAVSRFDAPLPHPETFEVYPNRDSLPFVEEYRFDPAWRIEDFVRGTIRLLGWSDAWAPVFAALERDGPEAEERLADMADTLWRENAYHKDEPDRVVLVVSLEAKHDGRPVWHRSWMLDAQGDARGSAMARLVSGTVSLAVEAILRHEIPAGVHSAPHDPKLVKGWLGALESQAQYLARIDHLA